MHRRRLYLLTLLAFLGSALLVVKLGGPAVFFTSRQEIISSVQEVGLSQADSQAGQAIVRGFGTVPALIAWLAYTRWLVTSRRARRSVLIIAVWGALAVLNAVVNNPISNPRFWFLTVLFSLLFTVFPVSAAFYRVALSLGVIVALVVFPFADRFRYDDANYRPVQTTSPLEPLALKDYDQVGMFANTITYVRSGSGHTFGRQMAALLLFAVPARCGPTSRWTPGSWSASGWARRTRTSRRRCGPSCGSTSARSGWWGVRGDGIRGGTGRPALRPPCGAQCAAGQPDRTGRPAGRRLLVHPAAGPSAPGIRARGHRGVLHRPDHHVPPGPGAGAALT